MARIVAVAAIIAALALPAAAQTLPRLHISALGMHADHTVVAVGQPFHVTIHVHVTEKRDRLDELVLPALSNADELGDVQHRDVRPDGTDFYQTLTVSAGAPGEAHFSPAYIDAVDPATGKALRYSSDAVTVTVTPPTPFDALTRGTSATMWSLAAIAGGSLAILLVLLLLVRALRRRGPRPAPAARVLPVEALPSDLPSDDPLRDAIALVRSRGDDAAMDTLRIVLFARAGLGTGATLADALRVIGDRDRQLSRTLQVAEYVRFAPIAERPAATRELLRLLYDYANGVETQS